MDTMLSCASCLMERNSAKAACIASRQSHEAGRPPDLARRHERGSWRRRSGHIWLGTKTCPRRVWSDGATEILRMSSAIRSARSSRARRLVSKFAEPELLEFVSGLLLANGVPHFVQGVSGHRVQSPFATPRGVGESSPLTNAFWGFANLVAGFILLWSSALTVLKHRLGGSWSAWRLGRRCRTIHPFWQGALPIAYEETYPRLDLAPAVKVRQTTTCSFPGEKGS